MSLTTGHWISGLDQTRDSGGAAVAYEDAPELVVARDSSDLSGGTVLSVYPGDISLSPLRLATWLWIGLLGYAGGTVTTAIWTRDGRTRALRLRYGVRKTKGSNGGIGSGLFVSPGPAPSRCRCRCVEEDGEGPSGSVGTP